MGAWKPATRLLFGSGAAFSMATQLGFALDGSGSVSFANFVIQRDGLAQAFNSEVSLTTERQEFDVAIR